MQNKINLNPSKFNEIIWWNYRNEVIYDNIHNIFIILISTSNILRDIET